MGDVNSPVQTNVNTVIQEALAKAGIPPRNIPAEPLPEANIKEVKPSIEPLPSLDGKPKGFTKGDEQFEDLEQKPVVAKKPEDNGTKPQVEQEPLSTSKADIETAINQASSKFQSIMDKRINTLQAQVQAMVTGLNQFFQTQEDTSISNLPKEEQLEHRLARLEKGGAQPKIQIPQQPIDQQPVQFYQMLTGLVDAIGLKIDDKRIDWAQDVNDPNTGFNRFLGSIKKALVEDQTSAIQSLKAEGDKEIQRVRKKSGIDKVSTHGAGGSGSPDIDKMSPIQKIQYALEEQECTNQANK